MGCGGSKQDVATGNTVTRSKAEAVTSQTIKAELDGKDASLVAEKEAGDKIDGLDGEKPLTDVKDIIVNTEGKGGVGFGDGDEIQHGELGKLISRDSPDQFFSSRKDESLEIVAREEGSEGLSLNDEPKEELIKSEGGVEINGSEGVYTLPAISQETGDGEKALVKEEENAKAEEGKASDKEIAELKAPVLVEEDGVAETKEESSTKDSTGA